MLNLGRFLLFSAFLGMVARDAAAQCSVPDGARRFDPGRTAPFSNLQLSTLAAAEIWETEPNNSVQAAMAVGLGDVVRGVIDPEGDLDYFAINVGAGTRLDLDVNAHVNGSRLYGRLELIATDGATVLARGEAGDPYRPDGSLDPRIRFTIPTSGRYFVSLAGLSAPGGTGGGPQHTYALVMGVYQPPAPGPGDPATPYASGFSGPSSMVAAPNGDLFVIDGSRVTRVSQSGQVSTFAAGLQPSGGLAVDGFGNLLVPACEYPNGVIWSIAPDGARSRFFTGSATLLAITVAADGDVWVADYDSGQFWEFDPQGVRKAVVPSPDYVIADMAFSPSGELHFTARYGLYKLAGNTSQLVAPQPTLDGWRWQVASLAFDVNGYVYVSPADRVVLLNPQYQRINDPFALGGDQYGITRITDLVFARDAGGVTTNRLLMVHNATAPEPPFPTTGRVMELNGAAIRAPGWPVGATAEQKISIHPPTLPDATVAAEYAQPLSPHKAKGPVAWTITAGTPPAGITLGEATGVLAGVPLATGSFAFTVRAFDGEHEGTRDYTLSVSGDVLSVELAASDTAIMDSPYANALRMPQSSGPVTWTLLSGALPPGITLNEGTGALAGVPADTGAYSFSVRGRSPDRVGFGNLSISVTTEGLSVDASGLEGGIIGMPYADTLRVDGATTGVRWYLTSGKPPTGLHLTRETGEVAGTPSEVGEFTFEVLALRGFRWGRARITMAVVQPDVAVEDAVEAVLGGGALSTEMERYLDYQGNRNGHLDVGDVRAFLRSRQEQARARTNEREP